MNELKNKRGGKMQIEFQILDALQKIHTPVLDGMMCLITSLGNAGIIWILLTIALLINPKIRRTKDGTACRLFRGIRQTKRMYFACSTDS